MGKASRQKRAAGEPTTPKVIPAPFVRRPFEGLPGETDLVAMREIVPAATATVTLRADAPALVAAAGERGVPATIDLVTVLPMAWPGLRRLDGRVLVALQTGSGTGDASRDHAKVLLDLLAVDDGTPAPAGSQATASTPRLQDLLDVSVPATVSVRQEFDFWMAPGTELGAEGRESLDRANDAILPAVRLTGVESAYWVRVGERTHIRWVLPHDEDAATNALARLHVTAADVLGEGTRLLGAFRACGLLAPVWDLDPRLEAADYEAPMAAVARALDDALADDSPLTSDERRAKAGLLSRQLTLR